MKILITILCVINYLGLAGCSTVKDPSLETYKTAGIDTLIESTNHPQLAPKLSYTKAGLQKGSFVIK